MAVYVIRQTVPLTTPIAIPVDKLLDQIGGGHLERVRVLFSATGGDVGVRLLDRSVQFAPANPDEWIVNDKDEHIWEEERRLAGPPYAITLRAYNTNAAARVVAVELTITMLTLKQAILRLERALLESEVKLAASVSVQAS